MKKLLAFSLLYICTSHASLTTSSITFENGKSLQINEEVNVQITDNHSVISGIYSRNHSTGTFNNKVTVNIGSTNASPHIYYGYGITAGDLISANSPGNLTFNNGVNVSVKDEHAYALYAVRGVIDIKGDTTLYSPGTSIRATLRNAQINISGKANIQGDVYVANTGRINLALHAGSMLTGSVIEEHSGYIKLAMEKSHWNTKDPSNFTDLIANNSTISYLGNEHTITINNLSGISNLFNMRVDLVNKTGDKLKVTGQSAGTHHIIIANNGTSNTTGYETQTVVETADGYAHFSANQVEQGGYLYNLQKSGNNWQLSGTGSKTTTAQASTSFLNTNYLMNYIDTQVLLQRMDELRRNNSNQKDGDVWIRAFGGQLNSFGGQKLAGFDMTYTGTQIGIDKHIATSSGEAYVGIMGGMTHANPNYRGGNGTTKDYHVGLYGTFIADNGFYVDAVAKYTYMKNHFSVKDTAGMSVQGKGSSDGYSASLEAGKRFHLTGTPQTGGYYFEPQAQITYGYQGGMSVNATNGVKAKFSNYNYTIGRASGIFGYEIAGANPVNIYFKTGYVREMDSSVNYKLNDQKQNYDFRGGFWDNGVGVSAQLNQKHNIYADFNYAKGNRFAQKQLNIGYQYQF